ncbi:MULTISPECIES: EVE domain-containing protein [Arthrospira]|jgi:predicted RNA-binding protein with PUA-like domain|uniref:EVE domain-containing protein n=1 Tax=Limnospira platensis NIES-46 TaxID=1236695 RepID=A0A5M3TB68_LIMPL|nr:EVE domain-containing protein [Arthrospira platensis]AMW30824.1 thymocyte nuclear protein 1 [Arthrospira platensis YZ]KDR55212.1 thymocyte nuclear protein 1 [Arthrospira platensis str. Paraca]MBD2670144.1 EVE domain-containing protein [Arthrospira platensis FACHB-439]MBD2710631.1 EVE domain-containing protein [Arthrospira platensis FACHB-835]MDF2208153.1 EVE domain-containing protein [Arthrospira platensis NCB002]MDT9184305.1 EVE domain-containing protein [Limnospira sp. PMC 289.06]MDT929
MSYWLIKSEEKTYSIDQMQSEQTCIWDGVRNYMARNFLRKMQVNDLCFFYHSNTKIPGIVGLVRVIESNIVDPTQFDENSPYYDPKATANHPRWYTIRVEFVDKFPQMISLGDLKQKFDPDELLLVRRGNRLSVMPIRVDIGDRILQLKIRHSVS